MTEPDEAIERLTAQLNELVSVESVGVMVKTADLAAVLLRVDRVAELEARAAKLEAALRPLLRQAETVAATNKDGGIFLIGDLHLARSLLKEATTIRRPYGD